MQQIHAQEKEQFKKLFAQEDIDNLEDRIKVLEVFLQTERHISEPELVKIIKKRVKENSVYSELMFNEIKFRFEANNVTFSIVFRTIFSQVLNPIAGRRNAKNESLV